MFKKTMKVEIDATKQLFRSLTSKENNHTNIFDFRKFDKAPQNKIIFTCEHATNNFHKYFNQLSNNDKNFIDTHWGSDPGAKDIMLNILEKTNSLGVATNFSRLIIDPNRNLLSKTLIRTHVEKDIILDINKDLNTIDREERINLFYVPYYNIMFEVLNFLKPKYFCSIHSFTPYYEDHEKRDFHVGLLTRNSNPLSKELVKAFDDNKISYKINEPYDANSSELFAIDAISNYNYPNATDGVLIEVRNDVSTNFEYQEFISKTISDALQKVIDSEN